MTDHLYKVAPPREDWMFQPRRFWRTEDWSSSTDHEREGHVADESAIYIEDQVLYVASFDEVNIHVFPKVWRLRVWLDDDVRTERLRRLGYALRPDARAVIFALEGDREAIEAFSPTVFLFDPDGFERTPSNEFVSREPRTAVSCETMAFDEAHARWRFDLIYVADGEALVESLRSAGVDHQIQT